VGTGSREENASEEGRVNNSSSSVPCPLYDIDSIRNGLAKLQDRLENRLIPNKLDIAETYVRRNLCLVIEYEASSNRSAVNRERLPMMEGGIASVKIGEATSYFSSVGNQNQFIEIGCVDDRRQDGVLIRVVEMVGHIEEVTAPVGEGLKELKKPSDVRGWCFYSVTKSFVTRSISSFREVELLVLAAVVERAP
jgi:hypothetical protein